MTPETHANESDLAGAGRAEWETPETVEVDLGRAQTANTNSNFDGTNYSS
jgi:hypothetical protein